MMAGVSGNASTARISAAVPPSVRSTVRIVPTRSPSQPQVNLPAAPPMKTSASAKPLVGKSASSLTFDHFYLTLQAALDGIGVAMGPTALIADDLAAGRLVTPFPNFTLPARSYFAYFPEGRDDAPHRAVFCDWLEQQGRQTGRAGESTLGPQT
jgi:DNA-binding transcriptional LysR family regulator